MITAPHIAHRHHNTMDLPSSTPPPRRTGGELPLGRRYAIAMEVALAIPPGKARVPKGSLGPICERYVVGPEHPTKLWKNVKAQMELPRRSTFRAAKGLDACRCDLPKVTVSCWLTWLGYPTKCVLSCVFDL